jgi:hypothetical protein
VAILEGQLTEPSDLTVLKELIAALDRRIPQAQRPDEPSIAADAAELRRRAVQQIADSRLLRKP